MRRTTLATLIAGLLALPIFAIAAPAAWQLGPAQVAKQLSIAGTDARELRIDQALKFDDVTDLDLALFDRNVLAQRSGFERFSGGWTWTGRIDGVVGHDVVISSFNGALAGLVHTSHANYEIRPAAAAGIASLVALDTAQFPACGGALDPPGAPLARDAEAYIEAGPESPQGAVLAIMDVMVLYTSATANALGGQAQAVAQAQAAVAATNTSYINSQMYTRLNLVAVLPSPFEEGFTTSLSTVLSTLRGNATVQALRNQHGADMVSLLVNDGLGSCGVGYVMRSPGAAFEASAYQVTASSCAVGNLSYAHEHGHNMGMEHDPPNGTAPASASYPWSFGHVVDGNYRTVMAYSTACPNGCTRRQYFSNPNVVFSGVPTGIADVADNHRTGNSTGPIVAAFRANADLIFRHGFDSTP